ncbi:prepilin-type N-terminal cleavage/methylation domain-containing protein [Psychrobacter sp. I-STPA6b]|uniref:prepilin-type N-terminal cleavage/methylation domain-containing protein n=1 Tax=Psychrobacter sp. I-STPA6b TaxID=2585718 RepID=UPI001D0C4046|nr:prepilin-type N-terminal cleavage/methylation domain-containing protein [Psychrobacter sp. I-STPA6b]
MKNTRITKQAANSLQSQQGFTLIELMIALVLGLLVAAAAVQVFYISQRTATTQSSASGVQDSAVFGLQRLEQDIRLAHYGAANRILKNDTKQAGVLLTTTNSIPDTPDTATALITNSDLLSKGRAHDSSFGGSQKSDQLTIQYKAPQTMYDCEQTVVKKGQLIIERYFLRSDTTTSKLGLACDSNNSRTAANIASGFGDNGQIVIPNVDQFRALLMTEEGYRDIETYKTSGTKPIYGIKLGLVLAGDNSVLEASGATSFNLLGDNITLASATGAQPVRRVYEPTILLRNARID